MRTLERLQRWHAEHAEAGAGVVLAAGAGGGWTLQVELAGTPLAGRAFEPLVEQAEDPEYRVACRVAGGRFQGECGPRRLGLLLTRFLDWAEHAEDAHR